VRSALDESFDGDLALELARLGVPTTTLSGRGSVLREVQRSFLLAPDNCWAKSSDAAERVAHLTTLAHRGRLAAITADLADPELGARISVFLRAHRTQITIAKLSRTLASDSVSELDAIALLPLARRALAAHLLVTVSRAALRDRHASPATHRTTSPR
jgi:hypothetical protein